MSKVSIGSLSKEVIRELKTYAKVTTGKVKEAVKNAGKTAKEEINMTAPKRTGAYAKSWAVKTLNETGSRLVLVVHSRNKYQLTHLLEYGHAKRGGGRVEARAHIKLAEEKAVKSFEEKIREAIEHD
ncbi:HK97 gp10 family phage protein [Gardnerella sp. DNF00476]|uniref:HK97 gp10 family phage protein n=1 Tax=Gardnerella TaxID=2701 RepID=UPI00254E06EB|nr:HK97 gp10 family phage protein [Gardnerella vaginalis]MDK7211472.1 HK97 gp10 family phage protein [Gardnerella vaginalis]MDK8337677.1 HK97 gp10 family phage protein [Gardnerella vaginalis]